MKKGFTLIELLAVIMVLAIIALVSTPIVLDVVDDARNEANKETVYGIIQAGKNYYAESMFDTDKADKIKNYENIYDEIKVNGEKPTDGQLYVDEQGRVAISVVIGDKSYVKTFEEQLKVSSKEDADIGYIGKDEEAPTIEIGKNFDFSISGENWITTKPDISIEVSDEKSGLENFYWCVGINCEPTNKETGNSINVKIEDTPGTQICVIAEDKYKNKSEKVCSEVIKVDTVSPEFEGIEDKIVAKDTPVDLKEGVSVSDSLSGMEGTYIVTPEEVDTTKTGTTEVKYIAYDKAGNIKEVTRKIIVSADAPSVTFTAEEGAINENGWAKEDFYVTINVQDNSGHGIKEFKVCTITENDECNPANGSVIEDTMAVRLISKEGNNNRICVQATDKAEKISEIICSDAYKLDKTNPVVGTIEIEGTKGENDWYTSDVTINVIDGTDELSGHLETTSNIDSIKENTNGTTVTVTTIDKAGNISTKEYTIKVDKTIPVVTIEEPTIDGSNGWYKTKPTIKVTASDTISTYDRLKICEGTNCEPTEEITESIKNITISDTKGTQVCVIAYDKAGNVSTKTCSNVIKVDTVLPSISGIADITVQKGASVNLSKDVEVIDTTSEVDKYTITPETVDTTKAGITNVTYKVIDKAGNEKTITRKVIVSAEAPNVTFTAASGAINNNGWAKNNFYVTINAQDNSGHGIKEMRICTSTTDTCNPANGSVVTGASATREIATEGNNNRICVQATDNYNQTSETICSDAYKLDKTLPTVSYSVAGGTYGEYKTIRITPNDSNYKYMSVHIYKSSTFVSEKSINNQSLQYYDVILDSNDASWYVHTTVWDEAGNIQNQAPDNGAGWYYQIYTIDANTPTVTISKTVINNENVLTSSLNPTTSVSGYNYQWYKNNSPISGATSTSYTTTQSGTYSLKVTTGAGKTTTSNEITINSYTIGYNLNGGTGSIGSTTKIQDLSTNITSTVPTRTGYTFQGWSTSSTATTATYASGGTYTANSSVTLYAVWKVNSYNCSSGYYLSSNSTSCTKCEAGSYCPGGTYTFTSSVQGKNSCPSGYENSTAGSDAASDCYSLSVAGYYIATAKAQTSTACESGYYCAPNTKIYYGSTGGRTACPSGYGTSPAGSDAANDCYLTTTAGKYIATANSSSQTTCESGYYCPSTIIYYGQTGGRNTCPSGYGTSPAGSDASNDCYKTITVSYAGNGATGGSTSNQTCNINYGNSSCPITLRANGFTKTNYDFAGWGTGTTSVSHNQNTTYSFSSNTTLNAIWKSSAICRRATTLHTEKCNGAYSNACGSLGFTAGSTITYGSLGTIGTLKSGDAFDCDVNGDGTYDPTTERFYYVSDLYNTTTKTFDSNYAVLIYYNNTTKGVPDNTSTSVIAYDSTKENWHGPRTAIVNLPSTTQWNKVSLLNTSRAILTEFGGRSTDGGTLPTAFSYSGYAARLLTVQELEKACGISVDPSALSYLSNCNYLMENTQYSSDSMVRGHWVETPQRSSTSVSWSVDGYFGWMFSDTVSGTDRFGVRPVIEVKKTDIAY